MKQRFSVEVLINFDKWKNKKIQEVTSLAERLVQSYSNFIHKESMIAKLKE